MRQILVLICATILLFGGLAGWLLKDHQDFPLLRYQIGFEILKLLVQFILTVILGGVVIQMYNRRSARRISEDEQRKSFLRRLTDTMAATHRSRLALCANAAGPAPTESDTDDLRTLSWDVYDRQMICISDAHLEAKLLMDELKGDSSLFTAIKEELLAELVLIVQYLDALKDEYRDDAIDSIDHDRHIRLSSLKNLSRYARSSAGGSNFYTACHERFESAITRIKDQYFRHYTEKRT